MASAGGSYSDALMRLLLPGVSDWGRVDRLGFALGAQPVLGRRLRALGAPMPEPARRALEYRVRVGEMRAAYLRRRLVDALSCLGEAGIPVMLLKGAALAHVTHGSFAERPMSDIDLLVAPADARRAFALLLGSGWERAYDDAFDGLYDDMHHLPPLRDLRLPGMSVQLELHVGLFARGTSGFAFEAADLWADSEPVSGLPAGAFVPSPSHRLLHCCVHFAWSHAMRSGAWRALRDIAAIWQQGLDWDAFVQQATRARAASCVYWSLRLARDLAAVPVPDALLARLGAPWCEPFNGFLARHHALVAAADNVTCPSTKLGRLLWTAAIRPGDNGLGQVRPWNNNDQPWNQARPVSTDVEPARSPSSGSATAAWLAYLRSTLV